MNQKIERNQYWVVKDNFENESIAVVIGINRDLNFIVVNKINNNGYFSSHFPISNKDFKKRVGSDVAKKLAMKYAENKVNRHLRFK